MSERRCRSGSLLGLALFVSIGFSGASIRGQSNLIPPATPAEQLRAKAAELEKSGKWNDALQAWCKLYGQDRQNEEANHHIQICLRRLFQSQRPTDKSLREKVLSLTHSQALAMYGEVLTTLHAAYVDKAKVTPARLFQQGLDEFLISLNDENFRKLHMPDVRDTAIRIFQTRLREYMAIRAADTVPDAVELVKAVAATAKRDLQLTKTSVIVLEFVGGACNSLDEYTSYLSPAELALETRMGSEASVVDVGLLKESIGYLRITHFKDTTPVEVDNAIAALE